MSSKQITTSSGKDLLVLLSEGLILSMIVYGLISVVKRFASYHGSTPSPTLAQCPFAGAQNEKDMDSTKIFTLPPYQLPPVKHTGASCMTMGLRRLDVPNWLSIDPSKYVEEHNIRASMLSTHRPSVFAALPGSEAACKETLDLVVDFLSSRYPKLFTVTGKPNTASHLIHNHLTNETTSLAPNSLTNPLETAARLAMEDLNILLKSPDDNEYHLMASATLFPAGWKLQERIGGTISDLHRPVPNWIEKLLCPVQRYFDHLSAKTPMERHPMFVQTDGDFWKDDAVTGVEQEEEEEKVVEFTDLHLRRERQTFRRLEKTGAVLFGVHTFMRKIVDVDDEEVRAIVGMAESWDDGMAAYKGREKWLGPLKAYARSRGI